MRTNIEFQTDHDRINFSVLGKFVCSNCTGLNEGTVTRRKINYIDTDGAEYTDDLYDERIITLEGYITARNQLELERARTELSEICNGKNRGRFIWSCKNNRYFTNAIAELPEFGERVGHVLPFVCVFIAYDFYWRDYNQTESVIASFIDHLKTTFQLPTVFTSRVSKAIVMNSGTIEADLVIKIICTETSGTNGSLKIYNRTSGKQIILNHNITAGEEITIDTKNCDIVSSVFGTLLNKMDPSSEFFKLVLGANLLEVENTNTNCVYHCTGMHYNTFVGV